MYWQPAPRRKCARVKLAAVLSRTSPVTVPSNSSPAWLKQANLSPIPTPQESAWLFDQQSLTRRLTELSAGHFSVELLDQGWQVLRPDECIALQIVEGSEGWVREVYLRGAKQSWVFARSVAARAALEGSGLALDELGSRSLGELLFSDRAFARSELEVCRYPADWLPRTVREESLWARRSCFQRDGLGVLVAEVFLPAFWAHAIART